MQPREAPAPRPRELEDSLNYYLYHPLAWRLACLLAPTRVTPNMVSVAGGLCVAAAAWAYAQAWWPWSALLGMALHMGWHVVDGADGDLARITGKASPVGEMVDGICDYVGHGVLYLTLGWVLAYQVPAGAFSAGAMSAGASPAGAWLLMLLALLGHIIQANHVEVQRRSYQWWVYAKPWLRTTHARADAATRAPGLAGFAAFYLKVAAGVAPNVARIDAAMALAGDDPAARARIAAAARAEAMPLLPLLNLLGPNPRAVVLGLSMLAGSPVWYFVWAVVVLNLLLVLSIHLHNQAAQRMLQRINDHG